MGARMFISARGGRISPLTSCEKILVYDMDEGKVIAEIGGDVARAPDALEEAIDEYDPWIMVVGRGDPRDLVEFVEESGVKVIVLANVEVGRALAGLIG
ncbi:MAG: hypothetical protein ABWK00_00375 [Desulfurococcaceae archaeon]